MPFHAWIKFDRRSTLAPSLFAMLRDSYEELDSNLQQHSHALKTFLGLVLTAAALWNPERIAEARNARSELTRVNQQIAKQATELAELLLQRSDLSNSSGFRTDTHYHV